MKKMRRALYLNQNNTDGIDNFNINLHGASDRRLYRKIKLDAEKKVQIKKSIENYKNNSFKNKNLENYLTEEEENFFEQFSKKNLDELRKEDKKENKEFNSISSEESFIPTDMGDIFDSYNNLEVFRGLVVPNLTKKNKFVPYFKKKNLTEEKIENNKEEKEE